MIIKKVKSTGGSSKASRVKNLTGYITAAQDPNKVSYSGGRGFIGDSLICQQAEMIALATDAPRSTNPISHWVMSWQEQEQPTREQVEQAIDLLLTELEFQDHQVIYAAHQDTDNFHLHLAINRVHPDTLKVIKSGGGFDVELAHKAIAKIENLQGWQRETQGRYQVVDGRVERVKHPAKTAPKLGQKPQDIEAHQGEKSAARVAIETGANLMRMAHSWDDLHQSLADQGMRYERYGQGAYLYVGDTRLKASSAGRDCSLPNLQKRLGEYQPAEAVDLQTYEPQPLDYLPAEQQDYIRQRAIYQTAWKAERSAQKDHHLQQSQQLQVAQQTRRENLTTGDWRGQGAVLNALRAAIAVEQQQERVDLGELQRLEVEELKVLPYPDFEDWREQKNQQDLDLDSGAGRSNSRGINLSR
jgi:Relaxase/Mobilisation nuclease domain